MPTNEFDDNEALWAAELNAISDALGSGGIVSGCSISKGSGDWDIDVTAGTIIEANTEASITADTVTITDASGLSSGESRVTLIHADTGDSIASTDGSAAADPASPDVPASEVLLGFVVVAEGDSTVADSDIIDIPSLLQNINALYKDGGSHELDAAELAGGLGSSGQILQSDGSAASWADHLYPSGEANDQSDVTEHRTTSQAQVHTLINISTSGYLLGGVGWVTGSNRAIPQLAITVDGSTTATYTGIYSVPLGVVGCPTLKFESSLQVDLQFSGSPSSNGGLGANLMVKT